VSVVRSVARWRTPAGVELPVWLRRYVAADWAGLDAWLSACDGWFDAHPETDGLWLDWLMAPQFVGEDGPLATLDAWPFNPYGPPDG
jgi:hypothetical protein